MRKLQNGKFFKRFLLSYLAVLTIPLLTILFTYSTAEKSIREEIISSSEGSLQQFFNAMDTRISETTIKAYQILNSSFVSQHAVNLSLSEEVNYYELYEIKQYITGFQSISNLSRGNSAYTSSVEDILVYFHASDLIVSSQYSSLDSRTFYQTYYDTGKYEEFYQQLTSAGKASPKLVRMEGPSATVRPMLLLSQSAFNSRLGYDLTVGIEIPSDIVGQMMKSASIHPDSAVMIYDDAGELLLSSGAEPAGIQIEKYSGDSPLYYDVLDGEKYVILLFHSDVVDCTYVSAFPASVFWQHLNTLRTIIIVSILLCMILSAVVAVRLAQRSYLPIQSVLRTIRSRTNLTYTGAEKNEIEFIGEVLKKFLAENDQLNSRIQSESYTFREDFLLKILQGTWNHEMEDSEALARSGLQLLSDTFRVALIRVEEVNELLVGPMDQPENQRRLTLILDNVFGELCASQQHQAFLVSLAPMTYAGIINYAEAEESQADTLTACRELMEFVSSQFGICCTIGISGLHTGLGGIHSACEEAEQVMRYRFVFGRGSLITHEEVARRVFHYDGATDSRAAQLLLGFVMEDGKKSARETVEEVLEITSVGEGSSLEAINCFRYDMISNLNKIVHQAKLQLSEKERHFAGQLFEAETFSDFKERLIRILEQLRRSRPPAREQMTVCDLASQYIQQNYQDFNLSNTSIGDHLHISAAYLSRLFKAQNGISLSDYLCSVRIEQAKLLLRDEALTIEKIAARCGFLSSSVFIKTFKKWEGITPGAYRRLTGEISPSEDQE